MYDVIDSIQASTQLQEEKIESLENFQKNSEEFISEVICIDDDVEDIVKKRKEDFYGKYEYLRPECEKEKGFFEKAKEFCKKVGEICKEHWKTVAIILIVIAAVALVWTGIGGILGAMAVGALYGVGIGGIAGGIMNAIFGGSFWEGVENGMFMGAIGGIISVGMGFTFIGGVKGILLTLKQSLAIGGVSGAGSQLLSDLGDIFIKNEEISFGQVLFNVGVSGTLGGVFASIGYGLSKGFAALKMKLGGGSKGGASTGNTSEFVKGGRTSASKIGNTNQTTKSFTRELNGIEESIISSWTGETAAYSAERLFQIKSGMPVDFVNEEDMMIHIWSNYIKR